uniref:Secreted protein n=1 Tax=Rhipicephalus zambeziensis TaxID=60191 RepID=A0A224YED4_9ACAR
MICCWRWCLFLAFCQSIFVHVSTGVRYTMPASSLSLSGYSENKKSALPNISYILFLYGLALSSCEEQKLLSEDCVLPGRR